MVKDLRSFINKLEKEYPDEIIMVSDGPLDPCAGEPMSILYRLAESGSWPMGVFKNVLTGNKKKWRGSIATADFGTWTKAGLALDETAPTPANVVKKCMLLSKNLIKPIIISKTEAPVKHTIVEEKYVDLFDLPAYRFDEDDAKPGWITPVAVGKDIETGRYNISWHRHLIHGKKRSAARINPRHLWEYMLRYKERGYKEMPVAWVCGHHPAFHLSANNRPGYLIDEYEYAGGFLGEPLRLTPSETLGEDFLVPADAEVILEGFIHLTDRDFLGPWSDFMRYYSPQTLEPVFRPTCFTMREDPVFYISFIGHDLIDQIGACSQIIHSLSDRYPRVKGVNHIAPFTTIIQYKSDHSGEVMRMGLSVLGNLMDKCKIIIVVDEDINPFNLEEVFFAIGTRVDPEKDVQLLHDLWPNRHDPSAFEYMKVGAMIIDATKPAGKPFPELGKPIKESYEKINLLGFLTKEKIGTLSRGRLGAYRE